MSPSQTSDPYQNPDRLAFESIGASTWKVLMRIQQAQLAGSLLAQSFFLYQAHPRPLGWSLDNPWKEIRLIYDNIEEEKANMFLLESRRHGLLSAIGAFDSCLSDLFRFLFLHRPSLLPEKVQKKAEANLTDAVEQMVRYGELSKWEGRLRFLESKYSINLNPLLDSELRRLIRLRNDIAHHVGLYTFTIEPSGRVWSEARSVPEVSSEDAQHALMIVTEVVATILMAVCLNLFGEEPRVKILTPEVAEVHKELRAWREERRKATPQVEEFTHPDWALKKSADGKMWWVGDINDDFLIRPTQIEQFPLIITATRHTRHGAKAYLTIDSHPKTELVMLHSKDFVEQLLHGHSMLLEFHEEPWPEPRLARYSLSGFAVAWKQACRTTENNAESPKPGP